MDDKILEIQYKNVKRVHTALLSHAPNVSLGVQNALFKYAINLGMQKCVIPNTHINFHCQTNNPNVIESDLIPIVNGQYHIPLTVFLTENETFVIQISVTQDFEIDFNNMGDLRDRLGNDVWLDRLVEYINDRILNITPLLMHIHGKITYDTWCSIRDGKVDYS